MERQRLIAIAAAVALLLTGCVTSAKVNEASLYVAPGGEGSSIIEPGDAIVIIPAQSADCLRDSLLQVHPTLRIVSPEEFRRTAFADQPADAVTFAYPIVESQQKLLATETFRDRIAPFRLRYLVSVGERELSRDKITAHQDLLPFLGFNWSTAFTLTASVIELKDGREVESIVVSAEGERLLVSFGFIPLFFYVQTVRGPVCKALGDRLGNYLAGRAASSGPFTSAPSDDPWAAYERGDYATALRLFLAQAEQGDADAQAALGNMYRNGQGAERDYVQTYMWFTLAVARFPPSETEKREKAIRDREEVAAQMTADQIAEAQRLASEWKPANELEPESRAFCPGAGS